MNLKKKLEKISLNQDFQTLTTEDLIRVVGGMSSVPGSCGHTGSSDGCDATAVCNCNVPPPASGTHKAPSHWSFK
ncbi:ComC/BlpC family leader-containing pheromone/bacteriocin [Pedobacter panaciterrae]|uniref:ComC/BlpC family leader-containing pheromone/bacteriocin n=1 Tax=Pedobacter panaciterrae TaxID=363849 RepID=UPI00338D9D63